MFVGRCLDSGFCVLRSGFCAAVLPSPPATRTDIMETIHAALLEAGSRIAPLASLDEIAGFFQAAAAIGPTAPARATAVAQRLGGSLVDAASMLASILPTLPSMPNVETLLSVLPPLARICISVPHETPVPCVTMACLNLHNASSPRRCSPPKVWSGRCSSSSAGARAAMPIITYRTQ